jgi:hypothetical protein
MTISSRAVLSMSYLGNLQYYSKFLLHQDVCIEQFENYQKQSFRNRCYIYGANGLQCLVIPVCKMSDLKMPVRDVTIDYSKGWQKIHWKSIESAYRLSPCFEFYEDELQVFFKGRYRKKFLFDWNIELTEVMLKLLKIHCKIQYTAAFEKYSADGIDYRNSIHPKKRLSIPDPYFQSPRYQQVFENKHDFIPNLSIIDLLFNEGGHACDMLKEGIRKI